MAGDYVNVTLCFLVFSSKTGACENHCHADSFKEESVSFQEMEIERVHRTAISCYRNFDNFENLKKCSAKNYFNFLHSVQLKKRILCERTLSGVYV